MTRFTLFFVIVAVVAIPAQAFALGELRVGGSVLVKPGTELDPASEKDTLASPYVSLDFQILELYQGGLILGATIEGASASNRVYDRYDTTLETFTMQASLGYRLKPVDWLGLALSIGAGADRGIFSLDNRRPVYYYTDDDSAKVTDTIWNWSVSANAAVTLYLPQSLVESWKPWDGFNFGIALEGGYVFRPSWSFRVATAHDNPDEEHLTLRETDPGSLDLSGGYFRVGVVWAF